MKYTVIYNEHWNSGSHWHSRTKLRRVERKDYETVKEMLDREELTDIAEYIFEGWPKLEGE
jgi:hypothetical protein